MHLIPVGSWDGEKELSISLWLVSFDLLEDIRVLWFVIIVFYAEPLLEKTSPLQLKMHIFTRDKWVFKCTAQLQSGYLFQHSICISSFVLPVLCLWALGSWGCPSGKQSYCKEMINTTFQWFPPLWVKSNVCCLLKSRQTPLLFNIQLCGSCQFHSIVFVGRGRFAAMISIL